MGKTLSYRGVGGLTVGKHDSLITGIGGVDGTVGWSKVNIQDSIALSRPQVKMTSTTQTPQSISEMPSSFTEEEVKGYLCQLKDLPIPVLNWEVEFKLDYSYEPSVYIYVTVHINDINDENEYKKLFQMYSTVRSKLEDKVAPEKFVYIDACFV